MKKEKLKIWDYAMLIWCVCVCVCFISETKNMLSQAKPVFSFIYLFIYLFICLFVCLYYQQIADAAEGRKVDFELVERFAFYERSKKAYAVVATGEKAFYANIILKKGIIGSSGKDWFESYCMYTVVLNACLFCSNTEHRVFGIN